MVSVSRSASARRALRRSLPAARSEERARVAAPSRRTPGHRRAQREARRTARPSRSARDALRGPGRQGSSIRAQILTVARILLRTARRAFIAAAGVLAVGARCTAGKCHRKLLQREIAGEAARPSASSADPSSLLDLGVSSRLRWRPLGPGRIVEVAAHAHQPAAGQPPCASWICLRGGFAACSQARIGIRDRDRSRGLPPTASLRASGIDEL